MAETKLVHVATVPHTFLFLRGQIGYMRERGFEVHAVASPTDMLYEFASAEDVVVHGVEMPRQITPFKDLRSLMQLICLFRQLRPEIVHSHSPKGGLLGMLAAQLSGVPCRVYHMRGLPYLTATGYKRELLQMTERISCATSQRVICVGHGLRGVATRDRLTQPMKTKVFGGGSSNGVDATDKFNPRKVPPETHRQVRARFGIPQDAIVVGFIGRLVCDKGIVELSEAWQSLREDFPDARLLVVGPFEERDAVPDSVARRLREDPRVHLAGFVKEVAEMYAAMDLLAFPSHREGFPNVPLEAASMELPVVTTDIPGCREAVVDGTTGLLVPPQDAVALEHALRRYIMDSALRETHGMAGRARALDEFRPELIWEGIHKVYRELLSQPNAGVNES